MQGAYSNCLLAFALVAAVHAVQPGLEGKAWAPSKEGVSREMISPDVSNRPSAGKKGRAGSHVEAAASGSSAHFGVGDVAQLHAHHPEPKGGVLIGHQLQGSNAVQLMQLPCHIK